jgi:hypothetical protein
MIYLKYNTATIKKITKLKLKYARYLIDLIHFFKGNIVLNLYFEK